MFTALVQFRLPQPITVAKAKAIFTSTARRYLGTAGLIRKYYVLSEDGQTAGGVFVWASRAAAERMYNDTWHAFVMQKYGAEPWLTYFETPVFVDNVSQEIVQD